MLRVAVEAVGPRNWKLIATDYMGGGSTDVQCLHRWQKVLQPGLVKGPWSIDEDKISTFFKTSGATVTGTRWLNDKESGEFKGIGFVTFQDTADVDKAVSLGGEQLDGRTIRLDYAGQKKKEGAWQGNSW